MVGPSRMIISAIFGLGLLGGALSVASARLGPTVDSVSTASSFEGTSVNTQIGLTFTEGMNPRSVQRHFSISPRVAGDFSWSGNTLFFTPRRSLAYSTTYSIAVTTGAQDISGKHLARRFHATFTTQAPHLLYLGTSGAERNRLVLASSTGKRRIVGSDGEVTDFGVSADRSLVVYVKRGGPGQRSNELWLLSLIDDSTQRLFRHADWSIRNPHFSPDGRSVVFLATNVLLCQKYYGCFRNKSGPVIYLLSLRNYRAKQFQARADVPITDFIDFSPKGELAYTDLGSALTLASPDGSRIVHIPNLGNSLEYAGFDPQGDKAAFVGQTPSSSGGDILVYRNGKYVDVSRGVYDSSTPAFSTSGKRVAYAAYRGELGIEPIYGINVYDFDTGRTTHLTSERRWSDWAPQWSLDDRYIAFIRSAPAEAMYMGSGEIWVMRSSGGDPRPLGGIGTDIRWVS